MKKNEIILKKISDYAMVGGLGAILVTGLVAAVMVQITTINKVNKMPLLMLMQSKVLL